MPAAASFAELLDAELARLADDAALTATTPTDPRPSTFAPASFVPFTPFEIPFAHRPTTYRAAPLAVGRPGDTPTPGEVRARLALESATPRPMDFTPAELRAAFRQLARQYHPDRHPNATGGEVLQYSRTFTSIASNYRQLVASVASRD